jgi:hypothetical protein
MALIPNLPPQEQELLRVIKTPQGTQYYMHDSWHTFFSQLITELQNNLSNEGVGVPAQPTASIASLTTSNRLLVDSTQNLLQINLNGVLKTIQTS